MNRKLQEFIGPGPALSERISLRLTSPVRNFLQERGNSIADAVRAAIDLAIASGGVLGPLEKVAGDTKVVKVFVTPTQAEWLHSQTAKLEATRVEVIFAAARALEATAGKAPRRHGPIVSAARVGDLQLLAVLNTLRTLRDEMLTAYPPVAACEVLAKLSAIERELRHIRETSACSS